MTTRRLLRLGPVVLLAVGATLVAFVSPLGSSPFGRPSGPTVARGLTCGDERMVYRQIDYEVGYGKSGETSAVEEIIDNDLHGVSLSDFTVSRPEQNRVTFSLAEGGTIRLAIEATRNAGKWKVASWAACESFIAARGVE